MLQDFFTTTLSTLVINKAIDDYEKNQKENIGTLKPPKFTLVVGIISMVILATLMLIVLFFIKDAIIVILCAIFSGTLFTVALFVVLYERNCKVLYRDGMIIYRNIFRITSEYACKDIEHTYYKDNDGIQFIFRDGRKLSFTREEKYFYREIVRNEHLKYKFKGEEKPIIKVYFHPFFMYPYWLLSIGMLICTYWDHQMFLLAILLLLFCLGCQLSYTTYDKAQKILTCTKCGFSKQYNMNSYLTKPVYENRILIAIELYEKNKRVAKIPTSAVYKNRAKLIHALCEVDI